MIAWRADAGPRWGGANYSARHCLSVLLFKVKGCTGTVDERVEGGRFRRLQNFSTTGTDSGGLVRTPEEWINAANHLSTNGYDHNRHAVS